MEYPKVRIIAFRYDIQPIKILETHGEFFNPLLATCITGAARLMLALSEWRAAHHGINWTFCDTDGLALAKPDDMARGDFLLKCRDFLDWFKPLNPYDGQSGVSVLEPEDENFDPAYEVEKSDPDWSRLKPLFLLCGICVTLRAGQPHW